MAPPSLATIRSSPALQAQHASSSGFRNSLAQTSAETGLPGRPMHMLAVPAAIHEGFAGPHGDFPESDAHAGILQRLLHIVMVADRCAAGGEQDIGLRRPFAMAPFGGLERSGNDAEIR